MRTTTRTTFTDILRDEYDDPKDITVIVEHNLNDEECVKITVGCHSEWFTDKDLVILKKMLSAAQRIRKGK